MFHLLAISRHQRSFILLMVAIFISSFMCPGFRPSKADGEETSYAIPQSLQISLKHYGGATPQGAWRIKAKVVSLHGTAKAVRLAFESSDDLQIRPRSFALAKLAGNSEKSFSLIVTANKLRASLKAWIRLRIIFLPDYDKLISFVQENTADFSNLVARQQLIRQLELMKKARKLQTLVKRVYLQNIEE